MPKIESRVLYNYLRPPSLRIKTTVINKESTAKLTYVIDGEVREVAKGKNDQTAIQIVESSKE